MPAVPPLTSAELAPALDRVAAAILERHGDAAADLLLAGIADGGLPVASRLATILGARLGRAPLVGSVNIAFHRDDLWSNPIPKNLSPTEIPVPVDDRIVVLVDDVLFTGRTIRAALNEIFDEGRPGRVELAVLVDRGGRALPVQPDYVGLRIAGLGPDDSLRIALHSSDPACDQVNLVRRSPTLSP